MLRAVCVVSICVTFRAAFGKDKEDSHNTCVFGESTKVRSSRRNVYSLVEASTGIINALSRPYDELDNSPLLERSLYKEMRMQKAPAFLRYTTGITVLIM